LTISNIPVSLAASGLCGFLRGSLSPLLPPSDLLRLPFLLPRRVHQEKNKLSPIMHQRNHFHDNCTTSCVRNGIVQSPGVFASCFRPPADSTLVAAKANQHVKPSTRPLLPPSNVTNRLHNNLTLFRIPCLRRESTRIVQSSHLPACPSQCFRPPAYSTLPRRS